MRQADTVRLVSLAAIWGASFLFMRIAAPVLGPVLTAELRTLIAGIALAGYFAVSGYDPEWRRWGRHYVIVGILSSAVPFLLWAYAALSLTAGLLSVLNATAPMFGALCSAVLVRERLNARRILGLIIGVAGVALVTRPTSDSELYYPAIVAALAASFCYGLIATYIKRWASNVPSRGMAVGSQLAAGTLLIPFIALWPPAGAPSMGVAASILALGLVCGAIAYLLYFRLIADIGATGALTVTYLIPVFGVLWGALFLGETLSVSMLAGAALVVLGTVFVLRT
ncbi:MAG TPA: DMT family transporter [Burkholderiales bacterium]|nr:DMT family transporter [Burkholderiales bacterium]